MVTNRARQEIILIAPKSVQAFRDPLRGELPHIFIYFIYNVFGN
jgi:hypothetical protein